MATKEETAKQLNGYIREAYAVYTNAIKNADMQKRMVEGENLKRRVYGILKPTPLEMLDDTTFRDQIKQLDLTDPMDKIDWGFTFTEVTDTLRIEKRMR